jgi:hypothetical protein
MEHEQSEVSSGTSNLTRDYELLSILALMYTKEWNKTSYYLLSDPFCLPQDTSSVNDHSELVKQSLIHSK